MFDYEKIHNELESYLEGWTQHYDLGEIMAELREYTTDDGGCIQSIDDVDPDDFKDILNRWDRSQGKCEMEYGYVITCQDTEGNLFTVSETGFESYDEVRAAIDDMWLEIEDRDNGDEPVDYEIYEG